MSSLTNTEKRQLEKLLDMRGGIVLGYSDATYGEFFEDYEINIHGPKYQTHGISKANKMRSFWEQEPDGVVGGVLAGMLDAYELECASEGHDINRPLLDRGRDIVDRLLGKNSVTQEDSDASIFLDKEFTVPDLNKLPIDASIVPIIENRLKEVQIALKYEANLSVIFLCGSILEAVLLGAAQRDPDRFANANASPKTDTGTIKPPHKWSLAQLIDASCEIGLLKPDVKKFGHGLRDFRNYIHPYQELKSEFTPGRDTAIICFHVLKAALASVAGERS